MKIKILVYVNVICVCVDSELMCYMFELKHSRVRKMHGVCHRQVLYTYIQLYTHTHIHTHMEWDSSGEGSPVQYNKNSSAYGVDRPDCHADDIDSIFASLLAHIFLLMNYSMQISHWMRERANEQQYFGRRHEHRHTHRKTINGARMPCRAIYPCHSVPVDCVTLLIYWTFDRIRQ